MKRNILQFSTLEPYIRQSRVMKGTTPSPTQLIVHQITHVWSPYLGWPRVSTGFDAFVVVVGKDTWAVPEPLVFPPEPSDPAGLVPLLLPAVGVGMTMSPFLFLLAVAPTAPPTTTPTMTMAARRITRSPFLVLQKETGFGGDNGVVRPGASFCAGPTSGSVTASLDLRRGGGVGVETTGTGVSRRSVV